MYKSKLLYNTYYILSYLYFTYCLAYFKFYNYLIRTESKNIFPLFFNFLIIYFLYKFKFIPLKLLLNGI